VAETMMNAHNGRRRESGREEEREKKAKSKRMDLKAAVTLGFYMCV